MRMDSRSLRKHPLAACLGTALALGGPLLTAAPLPDARANGPLETLREAVSARIPALAPSGARPDATSHEVTNCNDAGAGSLRDAVANTLDGETVDLSSLRCSTITLTSGAIDTTVQRIRFYSSNAGAVTIDGGGTDRVIKHHPEAFGRLYVTGINITNGRSDGNGGCLYGYGIYLDSAVVSNCHVAADATEARGGAVYAQGNATLNLASVVSSDAYSATTFARGGGVYAGRDFSGNYATLSGNSAASGATRSFGGGAFVKGRTYLTASTIDGNSASNVGGLALVGSHYQTANIINSTISGNSASDFIGGVYSDVELHVIQSTIAFNCARATQVVPYYVAGIGLQNYFTAPDIQSSIISNNTLCAEANSVNDTPYDISLYGAGPITGANNLIGTSAVALPADTIHDDPALAPLADNGGQTRTHALPPNSPAIDRGNNASENTFDERGLWNARVVGAAADIGAFELQSTGPTRRVTNCEDGSEGSLRDVIAHASSGDVIDLSALTCSTITLTQGEIELPQANLRIVGPGSQALTIDADNASRVLRQTATGTLDLSGLSFVNGYTIGDGGSGTGGCVLSPGRLVGSDIVVAGCKARATDYACIGGGAFGIATYLSDSRVESNSCTSTEQPSAGGGVAAVTLMLDRTTIAGNIVTSSASYALGGGVALLGHGTITNSTISGNRASRGGGLFFAYLAMSNSTLSGNAAFEKGGGAYGFTFAMFNSTVTANTNSSTTAASGGISVRLRSESESSILFGNTANGAPYDFGGDATLLVGANNLIGQSTIIPPLDTITDDPLLGPLQDNGGPTFTHALLPGSPAIDRGNNAGDLAADQRGDGFVRVSGDAPDIGAFEVQAVTIDDHIFVDGFEPEAP